MLASGRIFYFVLLYNCLSSSFGSLLKRFENCDPNENYANKVEVTLKIVGNKQYADGTLNFTAPLDNTIRINATVEMLVLKSYQYILIINETKACDAIHKYFGEFWYDFERYAQMIPGMCPMPQGVHRFHNFPLNFEKITTLGNFPFGTLRITLTFLDQKNNIYTCIIYEFEHNM